jgi:hypothetical protein
MGEGIMKARIAIGLMAMMLGAAAEAQQMMPPGYVDHVTDGIHWKFVSAEGQARFGTVFTDGPTEFAPFFMTCRGGLGSLTFTLPQAATPAQAGSVLRLSVQGRALDIRVTKGDSMGAPALLGTFELAQMTRVADGSSDTDLVEVSAGRWKMAYAARDLASAFAAFRQACIGRRS